MPRARNIKYSFFMNDELAEHDPIERLFFQSLWCLADFKGDILWRSKKVKALTLPYDDVDIDKIAINLDNSGFIRFYSDGSKIYLNVTNFLVHQNPHKNERDKGSDIPEYTEELRQLIDLKGLKINRDKSGLNQDENETDPADSLSLIPDSLNPIPNPQSLIDDPCIVENDSTTEEGKKCIDYLNKVTNSRYRPTETNLKFLKARFKEGFTTDDVFKVIDVKAKQWMGTKDDMYLRPATLFNAEKFNQYIGQVNKPNSREAQIQRFANRNNGSVISEQ